MFHHPYLVLLPAQYIYLCHQTLSDLSMLLGNRTGMEKSSWRKDASVRKPHWHKRQSQRSLRCLLLLQPSSSHTNPQSIIQMSATQAAIKKRERHGGSARCDWGLWPPRLCCSATKGSLRNRV